MSQSSRHARGTRHSPGGGELEPLSRRLLQAAGVLSLLEEELETVGQAS
ncbi:MAG: hypothetical protein ACJ76D_03090 [Solirubrobacterales bacterium]